MKHTLNMLFLLIVCSVPQLNAQTINLNSAQDIINNSSSSGLNEFTLFTGNYQIMSPVNFSSNSLTLNANSSLSVQDSAANLPSLIVKNFTLGAGILTVNGGVSGSAHGITAESFTVKNGASMTVTGSAGSMANGIRITKNGFMQEGGEITAQSGTSSSAYGMWISGGGFTQNNGILNAKGAGSGVNSSGIRVTVGNFTQNGGSIYALGGDRQNYGIWISGGNFVQNQGFIEARGGTGQQAYGIYNQASFIQNGGTVNAYGGAGNNASGILSFTAFAINAGIINAFGGSNFYANGIYASYGTFAQNGGSVYATGGTVSGAYGIGAGTFDLTDGYLEAKGNDAGLGVGVYATYNFNQKGGSVLAQGSANSDADYVSRAVYAAVYTQTGGILNAFGGTGDNARGIYANSFVQSAGQAAAAGGSAAGTYGLDTSALKQTGGTLTATGGTNATAYGIRVRDALTVSNARLILERQNNPASLYMGTASTQLLFGQGSVLSPVVDLSNPDNNTAIGKILIDSNAAVEISADARFLPIFKNTRVLTRSSSIADLVFMEKTGGAIEGEFNTTVSGFTLEYTISKQAGDTQYVLSVERKGEISDVVNRIPCRNTRVLMDNVDRNVTRNTAGAALDEIWTYLDNSQNVYDFESRAGYVGRTTTAQSATRLPLFFMRQTDAVQTGLTNHAQNLNYQNQNRWTTWAMPVYQAAASLTSGCADFDGNADEYFGGASAGAARNFEHSALVFETHLLSGKYESDTADTKLLNYGFTAGWHIFDLFKKGAFNPWLTLSLGYSHADYTQKRKDFFWEWNKSSPQSNLIRGSFVMGSGFALNDKITLTPQIGADYTHIRQSGYTETNPSAMGLKVQGSSFNSLRPKIGLTLNGPLTRKIKLGLNAFYRLETLDKYITLDSALVSSPHIEFETDGENRGRSSGSMGIYASYSFNSLLNLGFDYNLLLEDGYTANRAGLNLAFIF